MKSSAKGDRRAGYTLVELLTILVIIGILASLAGPAMGEYVMRQKTRRALDRVAGDLALARMMAVRAGESVSVRFQDAAEYVVVFTESGDTVRRVSLSSDYPGLVMTSPQGDLGFNSRGLLERSSGGGYLYASVLERRDSLEITPSGRVYRDY